ncbi:hypothetical protein [Falsiroseomonas oryzae]|uniref:hypothetical protein n=1 Tax=Falsiroseomonas oryzae TaxID=2766473 RepID=UPI0022EA4C74|nr:hypothetical protein [Roseomonas sp. MO-31]
MPRTDPRLASFAALLLAAAALLYAGGRIAPPAATAAPGTDLAVAELSPVPSFWGFP